MVQWLAPIISLLGAILLFVLPHGRHRRADYRSLAANAMSILREARREPFPTPSLRPWLGLLAGLAGTLAVFILPVTIAIARAAPAGAAAVLLAGGVLSVAGAGLCALVVLVTHLNFGFGAMARSTTETTLVAWAAPLYCALGGAACIASAIWPVLGRTLRLIA